MLDAAVLYKESGFLAAPHSHAQQEKEESLDNFCNPLDTVHLFEAAPIVLQNRVKHVAARITEFNIQVMGGM